MKPLILGKAEVSFTHEYKQTQVWCEKKQGAVTVNQPVATSVTIKTDKEEQTAKAWCAPTDHFNFEKGRKLALARAFKSMQSLDKKDRARIWEEYSKLKPGGRW